MHARRIAALAIVAVTGSAAIGWLGATRIKSPAQLAAEKAPPAASLITVPVEKRTLSADVVTRGTVRHRGQQKINLAASLLKPSGAASSALVTLAPEKGMQLDEGVVALAVAGRPVFVLDGRVPAFRDLAMGVSGDDVLQLEKALHRLGFDPGLVDGTFDSVTATAVDAWYTKAGWEPFRPTEPQRTALAAASDAATKAKQTRVQADLALAQARTALASEARSAQALVAPAEAKADSTAAAVESARQAIPSAEAAADRELAATDADAATKTAAWKAAQAAGVPDAITVATADLAASKSAQAAAKVTSAATRQRALDDVASAERDAALAAGERDATLRTAQRDATRASSAPAEVSLLSQSAELALQEETATALAFLALSERTGIQVPADEVLFLPDLPRRIDDVKVRRGDPVGAELMTVSGLSLSIDAALSVNDAKLVPVGAKVIIEEPALGLTATGVLSVRSDQPGTNGADPQKFYVEVTPDDPPASLVGASVKLTIAVRSTSGDVLAVPLSALTVGTGATSRVEVVEGAATRFVDVTPGLVALGMVEVTATQGERLAAGDNVVVGRGLEQPVASSDTRSTNPPASTTTSTGPSTSSQAVASTAVPA